MNSKKVSDTGEVYSLTDIIRNPKIQEAMFGLVFSILGIKNEELGDDQKVWKARCVFQGSNVRTKPELPLLTFSRRRATPRRPLLLLGLPLALQLCEFSTRPSETPKQHNFKQ